MLSCDKFWVKLRSKSLFESNRGQDRFSSQIKTKIIFWVKSRPKFLTQIEGEIIFRAKNFLKFICTKFSTPNKFSAKLTRKAFLCHNFDSELFLDFLGHLDVWLANYFRKYLFYQSIDHKYLSGQQNICQKFIPDITSLPQHFLMIKTRQFLNLEDSK